jgi:hypothetical protein
MRRIASGEMPLMRIGEDKDAREALEEIGGERLEGSGFEDETPEPGFSDKPPAEALPR